MLWQDKFITPNKFSRPQDKIKQVKKIVIHWTANFGASANNHFIYFGKTLIEQNLKLPENKRRYASAHFFVDSKEALCIIPLNEITYHANDGTYRGVEELKPNANYLSIGIEMCVEKDGSFHPDTIKRTEDIALELCKRYGLNPLKDIVRHYDITKKDCPSPWVKNEKLFTDFKVRVDKKLNPPKVINIIKDAIKEGDNMKFELTKTQFKNLAFVFKEARLAGLLTDESWEIKAEKGEITLSEAIYLSLLLDHRRDNRKDKK